MSSGAEPAEIAKLFGHTEGLRNRIEFTRDTYFSIEIPRLRSRDQSVVGFIPSSAAAPCLPYTWPLHRLKARSMLARSISFIWVMVKTGVASSCLPLAAGLCGSLLASPSSNSKIGRAHV